MGVKNELVASVGVYFYEWGMQDLASDKYITIGDDDM